MPEGDNAIKPGKADAQLPRFTIRRRSMGRDDGRNDRAVRRCGLKQFRSVGSRDFRKKTNQPVRRFVEDGTGRPAALSRFGRRDVGGRCAGADQRLELRVFLQRFNRYTPGGADGMVEVLGRSGIGPKTSVLFLRIDRRIVVVAQGATGLDTLMQIDDPEEVAALIGRFESARPKSLSAGFRQMLQRFDGDHVSESDGPVEASVLGEGRDGDEQHIDRTRDRLGDLLSQVRSFKPEGGGS